MRNDCNEARLVMNQNVSLNRILSLYFLFVVNEETVVFDVLTSVGRVGGWSVWLS